MISIGRASASSFHGPPPSSQHTADHIDRNPDNNSIGNIRWLCKSGQRNNQKKCKFHKQIAIIVRYGIEKTVREWETLLAQEKTVFGNKFTIPTIRHYAEKNIYGFSYKVHQDLDGEVWKPIDGSQNKRGSWEISNMNRVKRITSRVTNILYGDRLSLSNGYPTICINGTKYGCHVLSFKTFFPEEYNNKTPSEMVLHEDDNKLDFRPENLRLGNSTENAQSAHDNGKYNGKKSARMKCASYINGVLEQIYPSQKSAIRYLKTIGFDKISDAGICQVLQESDNNPEILRYGRTWRKYF
jgi:hypothetical protein